jgi:ABC-type glycerol-3-phosphate transport system substrate-binding protein
MHTRWIVLPAAALILAGCGTLSRVDDADLDRPMTVTTTEPSATPTAEVTVTPTPAEPEPAVTTKPVVKAKPKPKKTTVEPEPEPEEVYYKNCAAVRAAGADPIRVGDPGYSRKLDRDGDGVACE